MQGCACIYIKSTLCYPCIPSNTEVISDSMITEVVSMITVIIDTTSVLLGTCMGSTM